MIKINITILFKLLFVSVLVSYMPSCANQLSSTDNEIRIYRIESYIENNDSMSIDANSKQILNITFPTAGVFISNDADWIKEINQTPIFTSCIAKVDSIFPNNSYLKKQIAPLYSNYNKLFPDTFPDVYTTITPYNQSVMLGDGYIAIGLNHYLGENELLYTYYPEYVRKFKKSSRVGIDVCEALIRNLATNKYAASMSSQSVLSSLIYEGLIIKLMQLLNTEMSIENILCWSDSDNKWIKRNEQSVWQYIIANDILYSSDSKYINQLIESSPVFFYTTDRQAPSMVGRYIGYKIVDKYLKYADKTLTYDTIDEIVHIVPQKVLMISGYNGR